MEVGGSIIQGQPTLCSELEEKEGRVKGRDREERVKERKQKRDEERRKKGRREKEGKGKEEKRNNKKNIQP